MSDDPPGDEPDRADEPSADRQSEGWLSSVLAALERLEEASRTDRRRSNRSTLDYSVSVRSGLEELRSRRTEDDSSRDTALSSRPSSGRRPRTRRRYESSVDSTVTTRTYDDELILTADLPGVDPDDITVGFDDQELVIGVGGRELERVQPPWEGPTADAAIHNGILTVRVVPAHE